MSDECPGGLVSDALASGDLSSGGLIGSVEPYSPADDVGFSPGCRILAVDGHELRDVIDWRWYGADESIVVSYEDTEGDTGEVELIREAGQDWGIEFTSPVFDGIRQCRNACIFCFMRQLPQGMRPSLSLRDDDYRLSFLSGTFVTLTNLSEADERRIVEQWISPLRVSLHAVDADVRQKMMGRFASHGLAAFERLLDAGIEAHVQIVLVPGMNDGEILEETLQWAYAHPGILGVGIVPLGYTDHQDEFDYSFNEPAQARLVLETIKPYQDRALAERGNAWVFAADEFYRNAYGSKLLAHLPKSDHYGDFSMFEDGIGIIRSYVDDFKQACGEGEVEAFKKALGSSDYDEVAFVVGQAMQPFLDELIDESPLTGAFRSLTVENKFFGGNVDVTGLLTAKDMVAAIKEDQNGTAKKVLYAIPDVVFNEDRLTLDDQSLDQMEKSAGSHLVVVSCNPTEYLNDLRAVLRR